MTETLVAQQARARFIVTLPPEPSLVGAELLRLSRASFTALTDTSDAFLHLARRARERLVVMTPFIDAKGAAWAADIFEATTAHHKILVVRDSAGLEACGQEGLRLREAVQRIYDYAFRHERPDGPPQVETFHAKIVLADGIAAYRAAPLVGWELPEEFATLRPSGRNTSSSRRTRTNSRFPRLPMRASIIPATCCA